MSIQPFKPQFTKAQIENVFKQKLERIEQALISAFKRVGENFVKNARELGSYKDHTGNLRSSTGYIIMKGDLLLTSGGFVRIEVNQSSGKQLTKQITGDRVGEKLAKTIGKALSEKHKNSLILVCVAWMDYAAAVESKGYDVITGSSLIAANELKTAVDRIKTKISKK